MEKDLKGRDLMQTRVGTGILVSGRIDGEGDVFVEGRVDGEITIRGDLHIDAAGQVKADIKARNVFVHGILVGNAEAAEKLEIADGGRMVGDARAPRILINEGALFSGLVDMVDFEAEERNGEPRPRRVRPPSPAAVAKRPAPRPAARPAAGAPSFSGPRAGASAPRADGGEGGRALHSAPPLPKPPEIAGVRKAIIIKKKSTADG